MKKLILLLFVLSFVGAQAQRQKPKLIVGLVIDQMRWDFLYRYQNRYGNDGFNKLIGKGFSCENAFIPYTPTYTAAGHSSIYTGSVPSLNGIIGNNWYSKDENRIVYCTEDNTVQGVGSNSVAGKMSPKNLWSSTVTDELRLATNFKNKTIAIALKDRGAILPGGHTANAAYWFDNLSGGWISSSFYMQALPKWVEKFNNKKLPESYLKKDWQTLYNIDSYTQSTADVKPFEGRLAGEDESFPHITNNLTLNKYEVFKNTPFGNTYTLEMAKEAIDAEKLGKGEETDFLAVSLSSTDYIGHTFGPNSIEIEDTYLRLDKDIASFLNYLDEKVGKGEYLLFLSADHGAAHVPAFAKENKMPAGVTADAGVYKILADTLVKKFGEGKFVESVINYQIYLNDSLLAVKNINKVEIKSFIQGVLLTHPGIAKVVDLENLQETALPGQIKTMIINGYNQKLSGDIQYVFKPQWFDGWDTGTTHGSWNPYDSHIPLVWYGWNIKSGKTNREVYMTDIAPTIAAMLNIQMPNASIGKVIEEVIK